MISCIIETYFGLSGSFLLGVSRFGEEAGGLGRGREILLVIGGGRTGGDSGRTRGERGMTGVPGPEGPRGGGGGGDSGPMT